MKKIALIGNPNCGKTTLFNRLTGQRGHVGNWPGITVEVSQVLLKNKTALLADLPGLYSLNTFSPEESLTRSFLLAHTGVVWNLLSTETIERGLYLTLQLLEMGLETIVVLTQNVEKLDLRALSKGLGVRVVTREALPIMESSLPHKPQYPRYSRVLEGAIAQAASVISGEPFVGKHLRFWAISALEGTPFDCAPEQRRRLEAIRASLERQTGEEADTLIARERYHFIDTLLREIGRKPPIRKKSKADTLFMHKVLALPLFGLSMALLFWLCFGTLGAGMQLKMSMLMATFSQRIGVILQSFGVAPAIQGLVCDGIFGGLGTVLCFLPQLALLFAGMTFLEESGYLARAAFLADSLLRCGGFTGRAFVPLLMGFGCTTSAVLSARTLRGAEREKVIRLLPFCTCGAKFPVFALLAVSFFPKHSGVVVAGGYLVSFIVGLIFCFAGKKQASPHFILEIPSYRMLSLRRFFCGTWERCAEFLRKAGTVIFAMSLWIWLMGHIQLTPFPVFVPPNESILMMFAEKILPLFAPLGFTHPQTVVALLAGVAGKEAIVSTFGVLCETGGVALALSDALQMLFTPLSAVSFLIFCSLYTPCISALTVIGRELSIRKAFFVAIYHTVLAYACSAIVYQILMVVTAF